MEGLTKWGPSSLVVQRRVLPSGAPEETREEAGPPDPTWGRDLEHFEQSCARRETSSDNDAWVSRVIMEAARVPLDGA
jgi:hypothetical protein